MKGHWSRQAIVYHLYVPSFQDSDGDGMGDLQGVIDRLDYLNDGTEASLGVNAVWLSPICRSPMVDMGYDVSDHRDVNPRFGDLETMDRLIHEAHARGIRVILDFVPNHTSEQHPWFRASRSAKDDPKRGWYIWKDPAADGGPPNNWLSVFGGSAWEYDPRTEQYYLHSFFREQPDLNWRNPEVRREMTDIMRFWFDRGVDGFRLDAIYHLFKDEKFRDEPRDPDYDPVQEKRYRSLLHIRSQAQHETLDMTRHFCALASEAGGRYLLGEARLTIDQMLDFYAHCDQGLFAPFNFNLMSLPWTAQDFREFIDDFDRSLPENAWPNYVFGNHDLARMATRIGHSRARAMAVMLLTLRGMPFIYYGDELGMKNVRVPEEAAVDPLPKRDPSAAMSRDPARTPMRWSGDLHAGFTTGEPWLPVGVGYEEQNVEAQRRDPHSFFNLYRAAIHFRAASSALCEGAYRSLDLERDVFGYLRESDEETILAMVNFKEEEHDVESGMDRKGELVLSSYMDREEGETCSGGRIRLRKNEAVIIRLYR